MARNRILIVDDEENIGRSLRLILEREGYAVTVCRSISDCRSHPDTGRADVFLLDVKLPDGNGIDLLRDLRGTDHCAPAVMISGHATIADAVEATRAGAFDFLEKPLGRDRVLLAVKNALEQANLRQENARLRELVALAEAVTEETKIRTIVDIIADRFAGRQVLLFTEYKATQAAMMSALMRRFGAGCGATAPR